jgi:hypothetical protein
LCFNQSVNAQGQQDCKNNFFHKFVWNLNSFLYSAPEMPIWTICSASVATCSN